MRGARTWVEIDSWALRANLQGFRRRLNKNVHLGLVVKANAYGHGTTAVVRSLARQPFWGFCVASGDEALALRPHTNRPILVLSSWRAAELPSLIRARVRLVAWDLGSARTISRVAQRLTRRAAVHVKIDTGTSRIGVPASDAREAITALRSLPGLTLDGIFSQLADSEDHHRAFTEQQIAVFNRVRALAPHVPLHHVACTAAALRYPAAHNTLVRLGLGLYGLWPSRATEAAVRRHHRSFRLAPVLTWKTRLLQVKELPAGTPVGYALTFRTRRRTRLGIVPIGYWDGYDRRLGNRAHVLIRGHRAPVIGRVSMNLTMVDVTDIPAARAGEHVTLLGQQGQQSVTAEDLATWADTINYEVVARIAAHVPRVVV